MATMTPSSFDPLKRYVNVRLQQGVPIVDADMNELDDVRKFELRAFLKWYVGDGVPEGNDGFRVTAAPTNPDNDFLITAGMPSPPADSSSTDTVLRNVGRLVVDGLDVIIDKNLRFTEQPLYDSRPGAAALAARWNVPVVSRMTTPPADGQLVVYVDMWERLVTADEAPELMRPGLGVESCARTKREWVVRVRSTMPKLADTTDYLPGHAYYQIATLVRRKGVNAITAVDVVDRRERRLLMPPAHLLADTIGLATSPVEPQAYRRGEGRPAISLRDAINSLIAGRVPSTPEVLVSLSAGEGVFGGAVLVDSNGGLVVCWERHSGSLPSAVMGARLDLTRPEPGFESKVVGGGQTGVQRAGSTAVALPDNGLLVAYQTGPSGAPTTDVLMQRASTFAQLSPTAPQQEQTVASTSGVSDDTPHAVVVGDTVVFFTSAQGGTSSRWHYRRYKYATNSFQDANMRQLSWVTPTNRDLMHAAAADGVVWVAAGDGINIQLGRMRNLNEPEPTTDVARIQGAGPSSGGSHFHPFVLPLGANDAMVFFKDLANTPKGLRAATTSFVNGQNTGFTIVALPETDENEGYPMAVRDGEGSIYLFSSRGRSGPFSTGDILMRRRNAGSAEWSPPQRITMDGSNGARPNAVFVPGSGIWLFWTKDRSGTFELHAKRIFTSI